MNKGIVNNLHILDKDKNLMKEGEINLIFNRGIEGNYYFDNGDRHVTILALEAIESRNGCVKRKDPKRGMVPGNWSENITTKELDTTTIKVGDILKIGQSKIEIIHKARQCKEHCPLYAKDPQCMICDNYLFGKIIQSGTIKVKQEIEVVDD